MPSRNTWKWPSPDQCDGWGFATLIELKFPTDLENRASTLKCAPSVAPGMPNELRSFLERLEYAYPDGVKLATTFATVEGSAHKAGYLLDLDVVWESETASKVESAMGLADDLRNRERDAFEALITDELRKLFDAQTL